MYFVHVHNVYLKDYLADCALPQTLWNGNPSHESLTSLMTSGLKATA
jgi:hypothetical protein